MDERKIAAEPSEKSAVLTLLVRYSKENNDAFQEFLLSDWYQDEPELRDALETEFNLINQQINQLGQITKQGSAPSPDELLNLHKRIQDIILKTTHAFGAAHKIARLN